MSFRFLISAFLALFVAQTAFATNTSLTRLGDKNRALGWEAIGRLDIKGVGYCTGTLIAPELVLTAAHCVYNKRTGDLLNAQELTFKAGLRDGTSVAERSVAQIEAHVGYNPRGGVSLENVRHDVALIKLADPIPTHVLNPFALHGDAITKGPVSVVSYGRGRSDALSRQRQCQMLDTRDDVLALDCDVTFGSSGAPVFSHKNGRGRILAVISGTGSLGKKEVAFGMALPRVVADLKRQMRANASSFGRPVKRITVGSGLNMGGAKFVKP